MSLLDSPKTSGRAESTLFGSASLCCGALVRVVQARALPFLPKIMNPLFKQLSEINERNRGALSNEDVIVQEAVLRTLYSVVQTIPQFVTPYLPSFLSTSGFLSPSIRSHDSLLLLTLKNVDEALATHVAPRHFVPAASSAMSTCVAMTSKLSLLSMLQSSVENAPNKTAVALVKPVFGAITAVFDHEGTFEERLLMTEKGSDLLHVLVLKLSEVQLRRLFTSLREWRGNLNEETPQAGAAKRLSYWIACSKLSATLKSIFLPCLSLTFDDAVAELEFAASCLVKGKRGSKELDVGSLRTLRPILLCLERSLNADALQGGSWIRADDNQKYETLLEPLGKLLEARVPRDSPVSFEDLVHGEDGGSVVGCLTKLALAGGNEQLWKPMNYALLEACGNEERAEVRKAGLLCLLSLVKSLGEEYMVLIPECLPVLSELLEDSNEEIVSLSKEIVTLSEELIGESLEDSLR